MDARRDDDGRQHVRQRAQGPRRRAVQRAVPAARHHRGISGTRPELAGPGGFGSNNWWSADLGVPSSVGGQNDVRYAFFPGTRRLAIQINGVTKVFDTGEHHIGGVQQQQGTGYSSVELHQPVRHLRRLESARARLPSRWLTRLPRSAGAPVAVPVRPGATLPAPGTGTRASRTRATAGQAGIRRCWEFGGHRRGHRIAGRVASARHPLRRGIQHEESRTAQPALTRPYSVAGRITTTDLVREPSSRNRAITRPSAALAA